MEKSVREIAKRLQGDIPLTPRPFQRIGVEAGFTESEVVATVREFLAAGVIRKFGAVLSHREAGYSSNAMVVWAAPPERAADVGRILAGFREVTHCYERVPAFEGKYTVFSMIHFRGALRNEVLEEMSLKTRIGDYKVLRSLRELKKTSMVYF